MTKKKIDTELWDALQDWEIAEKRLNSCEPEWQEVCRLEAEAAKLRFENIMHERRAKQKG